MLHTLAGFLIVKSLDQLLWKRFQNAGKSSERISANAQLARKRNSYANVVQNQSKNREWIRTTKTAWSESTETDTANQTLLVPANMYIIQLHTWECVLLNKLVQTLCLWNNLCIIDCIAGVTLLDHLLWKHRSLESSWQNQNHPTNRCKTRSKNQTKINQKTIQHRCKIDQQSSKIDAKSINNHPNWTKKRKRRFYENERLAYTKHSFSWFQDMLLESKVRVQMNLFCFPHLFCFPIRFSILFIDFGFQNHVPKL